MDDAKRKAIEAANDAVGARHGGMKPGFDEIEAAIDAYEAAMLEAGRKMTPRRASPDMLDFWPGDEHDQCQYAWRAMWDAVPSQETNDG